MFLYFFQNRLIRCQSQSSHGLCYLESSGQLTYIKFLNRHHNIISIIKLAILFYFVCADKLATLDFLETDFHDLKVGMHPITGSGWQTKVMSSAQKGLEFSELFYTKLIYFQTFHTLSYTIFLAVYACLYYEHSLVCIVFCF